MTERPRTTAHMDLREEAEPAPVRPGLRVVHEPEGIDLAAAEAAAGRFLNALGISTASESLR
ncbi:GTP cyclohydrolase I FolE, partial [Streptomyces sp. NPDC048191]